ncbi:hypothetical protein [Fusobacterium animalis]|uniref:hypothetical protein n=1 Tax=Fusobacterium animalis TaxID=76859 RepID=UPI0030D1FAB0
MSTIRLSEEQKKAIKGFSILKNKSISSVVLEAILNEDLIASYSLIPLLKDKQKDALQGIIICTR